MFKRSKQTLEMCDLFRNANGHLSYATIETHFGKTINELRPTIIAAKRYLERDESIVFECIRGEGYKRLDDSAKVDSLKTFTRRIRRTATMGNSAHIPSKNENNSPMTIDCGSRSVKPPSTPFNRNSMKSTIRIDK